MLDNVVKSNQQDNYLVVGQLGRSRGIAGEIWVTPETDFPDRFEHLKEIYILIAREWVSHTITSAKMIGGRPVLKFSGIKNKEEVARFTNMKLAVPTSEAVKLAEGTHYVFDLIGCKVIGSDDNNEIGELIDIIAYPANDVYVIRDAENNQLLFPAVTEFVIKIDNENKIITINRDGLVDQNSSSKSQ